MLTSDGHVPTDVSDDDKALTSGKFALQTWAELIWRVVECNCICKLFTMFYDAVCATANTIKYSAGLRLVLVSIISQKEWFDPKSADPLRVDQPKWRLFCGLIMYAVV